MPPLNDYEVYIFDCDGVILDSNQLKIKAMKQALYDSWARMIKSVNA